MNLEDPYLIIAIDDKKFIFFVIKLDEKLDFTTLYSDTVRSEGILGGKIIDINLASNIIKKQIEEIEKKINFVFKNSTIIIDPNEVIAINVSGFKKLNGSQINKEDITYILNNTKKNIKLNEPKQKLIHLFNSNFTLDKNELEKIPIGLHGEFYNQDMTFLMINKNFLKNIKLVLNFCNINVERVILKSFANGIYKISKDKEYKNSIIFEFKKDRIITSVFKKKSYVYSENFNFGTDLVIKDIAKVCSLDFNLIRNFLEDLSLEDLEFKKMEGELLNKRYFGKMPYRKISVEHILNIINSRIDEMIELILDKNINMAYFRKDCIIKDFIFEDSNLIKFFELNFKKRNNIYDDIKFNKNLIKIMRSLILVLAPQS